MTTSGITVLEMTGDQIIEDALRNIGAISLGQTPSPEEYTIGRRYLNNLVGQFKVMGMPVWAKKTTVVPMVAGQTSYTIGIGQINNFAFPLKILEAWTEPTTTGGGRQPLAPLALYDFNLLPLNAGNTGTPSQYTYQPKINLGVLSLWVSPDASCVATRTLSIHYQAPFELFVSSTDTPYFPQEWNNALIFGLSSLLSPMYGTPLNDRSQLKQWAQDHLNIALDFGLEEASVTFAPDTKRK